MLLTKNYTLKRVGKHPPSGSPLLNVIFKGSEAELKYIHVLHSIDETQYFGDNGRGQELDPANTSRLTFRSS